MRYILGILATVGLIILILVLLFRGGGSAPKPKNLVLSNYAHTGSTATYIIDGPIVADQDRREIKIDVSSHIVTFTLYRGYEGDVLAQQTYGNNDTAYTSFLKGLQNLGFTLGNNSKALQDERGRCPNGQRTVYQFTNESDTLIRFWSTSCGEKTFNGSIGGVDQIFRRQIPDYNQLTTDTPFGGVL